MSRIGLVAKTVIRQPQVRTVSTNLHAHLRYLEGVSRFLLQIASGTGGGDRRSLAGSLTPTLSNGVRGFADTTNRQRDQAKGFL